MWRVSNTMHAVCLQRLHRCMQLLAMMPSVSSQRSSGKLLLLRLLLSLLLLGYLVFVLHWRINFKYRVIYDSNSDTFSRILDLLNFLALIVAHGIIVMELVWRNRRSRIAQQCEQLRQQLYMQLGRQLNMQRLSRCVRCIYLALLVRIFLTIYFGVRSILSHGHTSLLFYALYSELVLLLRFSEFSLHVALVWHAYHELHQTANKLVSVQLQQTSHEIWSVRCLLLQRLARLQQLHGQLWQLLREIEGYFELSLTMLFLKYFIELAVMPYWMFMNQGVPKLQIYCFIIEVCKLSDVCVPCWLCQQCAKQQRELRCLFYSLSHDRRNPQLNAALQRINSQLNQETFYLTAGGFLRINNQTLGKFIFAVFSYIVICIQFRMSFKA